MSYATELPKSLVDFLNTPIPDHYPRKTEKITATHSTYVQLEDPKTEFRRTSIIQDSTVALVARIFESLPPGSQEKLLEDIAHVDPVFLESSAGLMLNHHVLQPVKIVLNLLWMSYRDSKIARRGDRDDHRVLYLLKHFQYGFAIRSQHHDASDANMSKQDHILTFEPCRMHEDITKTTIKPAGTVSFSTDLDFNTKLAEFADAIVSSKCNEREFKIKLKNMAKPLRVEDVPCLAMTIIEEKKPGTLSPNAWQQAHNHIGLPKADTAEGNERKITGQIRGYAFLRNCPNFLVSQFDVNVLLMVDDPACHFLDGVVGEANFRKRGIAELTVDEDAQRHTPRAKLFYMVVERALQTILTANDAK